MAKEQEQLFKETVGRISHTTEMRNLEGMLT